MKFILKSLFSGLFVTFGMISTTFATASSCDCRCAGDTSQVCYIDVPDDQNPKTYCQGVSGSSCLYGNGGSCTSTLCTYSDSGDGHSSWVDDQADIADDRYYQNRR